MAHAMKLTSRIPSELRRHQPAGPRSGLSAPAPQHCHGVPAPAPTAPARHQRPPARRLVAARSTAAPALHSTIDLDDIDVAVTAKLAGARVVAFSATQYVRDYLSPTFRKYFPKTHYVEAKLDEDTAMLAADHEVAILFVNDDCNAKVVEELARGGVKLVALRCAGFDRVDLAACQKHGIQVVRVPTYSPESVAEHAVALMFCLNRHLHSASIRVRMGNYSLSGLVGFEMRNKVVGVVGTGAIGEQACRILKGIGCNVLAYDIRPNPRVEEMGIPYMGFEEMLPKCDILTLHCPLLPSTCQIINKDSIAKMKQGAMLINVSRGGLIDTDAAMDALETEQIGALGLDVYENEGSLFFTDFTKYDPSQRMRTWDRKFRALLGYPQVLVTPHSAFLTQEALNNIALTTCQNVADWVLGRPLANSVAPPKST